jgi:hypothetical protein
LKHEKIQAIDICKGLSAYSNDVISDISYEIRDVYPGAEDIIYEFIGFNKILTEEQLNEVVGKKIGETVKVSEVINILIWHGFLGIHNGGKEPIFIFNSNYNMKILSSIIEKKRAENDLAYVINPAFWPSLYID